VIALILGGAPSVFVDATAAAALLNRRHLVVAANLAGIFFTGQLDGFATLHSDRLSGWLPERTGNHDCRLFTPTPAKGLATDLVDERWPGSSGLYAAQVALFEMGASGVILCGVPMEQQAGHFSTPGVWASTVDYRRAVEAALPEIGARTRSMGGWTQDLFGPPGAAWIDAIDIIRPLGATRPQHQRTGPMHHVKNVSDASQRFHTVDAEGEPCHAILAPGEAGNYEINPAQAAFQSGDLVIRPLDEAAPAPKAKAKPKSKAVKAKPVASPPPAAQPDPAAEV
jgi:hypothetical protein